MWEWLASGSSPLSVGWCRHLAITLEWLCYRVDAPSFLFMVVLQSLLQSWFPLSVHGCVYRVEFSFQSCVLELVSYYLFIVVLQSWCFLFSIHGCVTELIVPFSVHICVTELMFPIIYLQSFLQSWFPYICSLFVIELMFPVFCSKLCYKVGFLLSVHGCVTELMFSIHGRVTKLMFPILCSWLSFRVDGSCYYFMVML